MAINNLIYPLADALQIALIAEHGKIQQDSPQTSFRVAQTGLKYDLNVVSGCYSRDSAAVIAHVRGDLYLYCQYWADNRIMEVRLFDAAKQDIHPQKIKSFASPKGMMDYAKKATVGQFIKRQGDAHWQDVQPQQRDSTC